MPRDIYVVLYILVLIAVVVSVDLLFFKNRFWERLIVNIGIVLVFAAFYLRFLKKPWAKCLTPTSGPTAYPSATLQGKPPLMCNVLLSFDPQFRPSRIRLWQTFVVLSLNWRRTGIPFFEEPGIPYSPGFLRTINFTIWRSDMTFSSFFLDSWKWQAMFGSMDADSLKLGLYSFAIGSPTL